MVKSKKDRKTNRNTFIKTVLEVFQNNPFSSFNYKQVSSRLGIYDRASRDLVRAIMEELYKSKELIVSKRGKYQINIEHHSFKKETTKYLNGKVDMKQTGKAYVIPDDASEDILVTANNTNHALHGDRVKVLLFPKRKGHKREGEIIEILNRSKKQFVGIIDISGNYAFLVPDSPTMPVEILIPISKLSGARNGQKVVAIINEWPSHAQNPFGEVVRVLGKAGTNKVEMQAILSDFDFPLDFSSHSLAETSLFKDEIPDSELKSRKDFRRTLTFTIDPEDAKDFDDAISFALLEKDRYEIGIHIADVSYYVKPESSIDEEAFQRATSVYMVHKTIPMLPEHLSNNLCSLQQGKDRLCFSAVFEMDTEGIIYSEWYGKTIIHSDRRFNYEEIQQIIETREGLYAQEIEILNGLAKKLRGQRFKKGSINFETEEVRFHLDEEGKPLSIYLREMKDANKMIEDFMLLANRKVAEHVQSKNKEKYAPVFIYRVHDTPNNEKLETFAQFVGRLGYKLKTGSKIGLAHSLNQLFQDIKGTGVEQMIESIAIRTMAKAYYSTHNIGHYGLGFPYYTHFTSPIRRYPDLMTHRLFWNYLNGRPLVTVEDYEERCDHSSEMERRAAEAERMSVKYKQAEFMLDKIGQEFDALISGVSKWGIYAEIKETKCEGMIRLRDLEDDYYYLDEENFQVIGQRFRHCYKLGDPIRIRVRKIYLARKQMDFALVEIL